MQTIDKFNFAGKKAFVRVDFNVPLDENSFHLIGFNLTSVIDHNCLLSACHKFLPENVIHIKHSGNCRCGASCRND